MKSLLTLSSRSACFLTLVGLLPACTTLDDFRKMTPDQRARMVCDQQTVVKDYDKQIGQLSGQISESQIALSRGYKLHKQCHQIKTYGNPTTSCTTHGNQTTCKESRPESYETRCTETPVPINPELEHNNINLWSMSISTLQQSREQEWLRCYDATFRMSPEEAYNHY